VKSLEVLIDAYAQATLTSGVALGRRGTSRARQDALCAAECRECWDLLDRIKAIQARALALGDSELLELTGRPAEA
jgi:hypothetical protein